MNTTVTKETWVYTGQVRTGITSPKYPHKWFKIDGDKIDGDGDHYFSKNIVGAAGVGGIYEVTITINDDGGVSVTTGGKDQPRFVAMHDDEVAVRGWHAEHRAALATKAADAERKRAVSGAPTMFDMSLAELRDVITGTNWSRREGIIGAAITYLMSGER